MICSFGDRIFGKVMIVGLDAIIAKTKFKILENFTYITHKFELRSFEVRHSVIPLLTPSLEARTSRRTIILFATRSNMADYNNVLSTITHENR